jgi:hypothetical protein
MKAAETGNLRRSVPFTAHVAAHVAAHAVTGLVALALGLACSPASSGSTGGGSSGGNTGSGGSASSGTGGSTSTNSGGSTGTGGTTTGSGGAGSGTGGVTGSGGSTTAPSSGGQSGSGTGGNAPTGGSGGTAGVPDAGGETAPPASTGAGCTGLKTVFCEDFEQQTAGKAPTGMFTVKGAVMVDGTKPFSGKLAGHIMLNNPGGDTAAQITFGKPYLPVASNVIWGRAMVYMTAVPGCCSTSNGIHWDLTAAKAGNIEYVLGSMYGNFMPVYQPPDDSVDTKTKWPEKKWVCIQWEFNGAASRVDVKVDGVRATPGIPVTKWKAGGPWTSMNFGWINFQPSSVPVDMWFDDLAFGETEIPCPTAPPAP